MYRNVIVFFAFLTAGFSPALAQTNPVGHWEGAIRLPTAELKIIVEFKQEPSGLTGAISIPDQGLKNFGLANVKAQGQELSFEMPNIPGTPSFKGTLSADGNSLEGMMSQGGATLPFKLRRFSDAEVAEAAKQAAAEAARKPDSVWEGTLEAGPSSLKLIVRVFKKDDGGLDGKLDSPDQGINGIAIPSVTLSDTKFSFEVPPVRGAFQGTLNPEKTEAIGDWSQMGNSLPLTLKRVEKPSGN